MAAPSNKKEPVKCSDCQGLDGAHSLTCPTLKVKGKTPEEKYDNPNPTRQENKKTPKK
jgi:hypothetical protein